jgi:hypothetical protein
MMRPLQMIQMEAAAPGNGRGLKENLGLSSGLTLDCSQKSTDGPCILWARDLVVGEFSSDKGKHGPPR